MKVVVEILTGTLFYIQVEEDATVSDLKRAIETQEKHQYHRLILMLNAVSSCKIMNEDDVSLTTYGVVENSHVYLLFLPPDHDNVVLNSADSTEAQILPFIGSTEQKE